MLYSSNSSTAQEKLRSIVHHTVPQTANTLLSQQKLYPQILGERLSVHLKFIPLSKNKKFQMFPTTCNMENSTGISNH